MPVSGSTQYFCWSYDSFGNRTYQQSSSAAFTNTTAVNTSTGNTCTPASGATILSSEWNNYYATSTNPSTDPGTNQIASSNDSGVTATFTYDAAGNVTYDGSNHYLYDAEGEQCAVENSVGVTTGYVYDAEGNRVAKGTLASFSCTATFAMTNTYILDQSNQQITEETVSGTTATWAHSNVFAAGELIATYDYKSDGTSPRDSKSAGLRPVGVRPPPGTMNLQGLSHSTFIPLKSPLCSGERFVLCKSAA